MRPPLISGQAARPKFGLPGEGGVTGEGLKLLRERVAWHRAFPIMFRQE